MYYELTEEETQFIIYCIQSHISTPYDGSDDEIIDSIIDKIQ
ncbi:hypothetical protein OAG30_00180 [Flavobacteriaceae bacterium]|nr:hypothetical protein [Flavobacteriaceae bacterium]